MRNATLFRLCACVLLALVAPSLQAYDSGSSGADGTLAPEEDVLVVLPEDGILNYSSVNIPAGVTVRFVGNRANTPVRMLVSGDVDIAGTMDVSGQNAAAVGNAGDGNTADDRMPGAGGPGGYAGGAGGAMGFVDASSNQASLDFVAGGHGKGPGGGRGGRYIVSGSRLQPCSTSGGNHASSGYRLGPNDVCIPSGASITIAPYGTAGLLPLVGGSGGGGDIGRLTVVGAGGGGGGGAILIAASGTVNIARGGSVLARGGNGGAVGSSGAYAGGGGSGGAVRIVATTIAGSGLIDVAGGRRGAVSNFDDGGVGRIRLEAETLSYRNSRVRYSSSTPGLVFISNRPRLGIASVASVTAPSTPSGNNDLTLTASADPVQVSISAGNVPLGTTVSLRVVPDYGTAFTVQGGALAGTLASSSASASVTLPAGHSVLYASASFRVEPSDTTMQSLYMPYTKGERVVAAELDGTSGTLSLLTESGREVLVSTGLGG